MLHCRIFIPPTHFNVFPTDLSIPGWIFSMYYLSLLNTFSRCGELTTKPTLGLVLTDPFFLHCCNLPCPSNTSPLLSFDCVPETAANKTIMFSVLVFILTGVWPLWNPRKGRSCHQSSFQIFRGATTSAIRTRWTQRCCWHRANPSKHVCGKACGSVCAWVRQTYLDSFYRPWHYKTLFSESAISITIIAVNKPVSKEFGWCYFISLNHNMQSKSFVFLFPLTLWHTKKAAVKNTWCVTRPESNVCRSARSSSKDGQLDSFFKLTGFCMSQFPRQGNPT